MLTRGSVDMIDAVSSPRRKELPCPVQDLESQGRRRHGRAHERESPAHRYPSESVEAPVDLIRPPGAQREDRCGGRQGLRQEVRIPPGQLALQNAGMHEGNVSHEIYGV